MHTYLVLLRGVNVGGKNKVPMAELRRHLIDAGYNNITTYIASGNVVLQSNKSPDAIRKDIETLLPQKFNLDSQLVRVLVLSHQQLRSVIDNRPPGFGDRPEYYHSDAIFLIGVSAPSVLPVFSPKQGVDAIWPGEGVIYSQRLSAQRTKSRLAKIIGTPEYQSMTVRSWQTTVKLLSLMETASQS